MVTTHNLGFPRIGHQRELKFALEKFWKKEIKANELNQTADQLKKTNWQHQKALDFIPVGDFSFYDHVLDTSFLLGHKPARLKNQEKNDLEDYFRVARGRAFSDDSDCSCIHAGEMTKWFDTNYHYIVPEFDKNTTFQLNADRLLAEIKQAKQQGLKIKPTLIGPVTYLWLGKSKDDTDKLVYLDQLIQIYDKLLALLAEQNIEWVQIDEPILVMELSSEWQHALRKTYYRLQGSATHILLATYFGHLGENLQLACELPVNGLHLDAINAKNEVNKVVDWLAQHKILSLGVINGRNIWKTDLNAALDWLEPLQQRLKNRLWLAPSCTLLHVPVDLNSEINLDPEIKSWLAFAIQKLAELDILKKALNEGRKAVKADLEHNQACIQSRQQSSRVHQAKIKAQIATITTKMYSRQSTYQTRASIQRKRLNLPLYPTTTIGSFPQTAEIRQIRRDFKQQKCTEASYQAAIQKEIKKSIEQQTALGLDVFVHGEAERNDMVEYFGEQLEGYVFSQFGWVQSYGSRCVKPPILFGDIARPQAMTVDWIKYAQSLTDKPVKGMLTGPVTMLNWSFVRDDQPRADTCLQLALAIRQEVLDLEQAGIRIIQIDEAALREGLPLRQSEWQHYLDWAVAAFKISANGVRDDTQIHTHMCYSEFNDIIQSIAAMDADVITIETSRSDMKLLDVFDEFQYPNEIGPGVYDIHSPNIPSVQSMVDLIQKAALRIPPERLWINPDCGLKTRQWHEVKLALINMVKASEYLRADFLNKRHKA